MDNVKFWYAVGEVDQLAFDDQGKLTRPVKVEGIVGEGHIVYSEVLLCRQSRDALKNKHNARKQKTVQNRISGVKLCEECEKRYKNNSDFAWQKWITASNEAISS